MAYKDLEIGEDGLARCGWVGTDSEYMRYHDEEWGVKLLGDQKLFEKLSLEAFQAGLSWITILKRRPGFREAFSDFNIDVVASFTDDDVERLMLDERIIRNRAKIVATIENAKVTKNLLEQSAGALHDLIWSFQPMSRQRANACAGDEHARYETLAEVPAVTTESEQLSKALKKLGFKFVGATTMYALMQSAGLVDDHLAGCHRAN
ncbi:DNA-3-methyladenine glycosylase I [Aurantimicrobium minutum]|uniref:DNA-3-methyladenine glycosylase I n=1 Tax=Aurantimicrobium minutum TaxID=708131 RepID=UPI0024754C48|nr:DNA-3-methyladenine glycosylase I [Aurantimicrobium minutum]MDH6536249.1 DNA-3-methyladenine glycosylase I [Aurantimicrobium minutum]